MVDHENDTPGGVGLFCGCQNPDQKSRSLFHRLGINPANGKLAGGFARPADSKRSSNRSLQVRS